MAAAKAVPLSSAVPRPGHGGPPARLIDVRSMQIKSIRSSAQWPAYAILSHTWGDEEVTLQEWDRDDMKYRAGYQKIVAACKQARADGLDYLWVDTCCINKENPTELMKAINSMYDWYKRSNVCYAHLCDVRLREEWSGNTCTEYVPKDEFAKARWFTRGWTLQELLAPAEIKFFDMEWAFLGEIYDLIDAVEEITGIDRRALTKECEIEWFSAAQKFSWAAHRETTEIEDEAYCLLGLCNVSIFLNYGEKHMAFQRLQEAILCQASRNDELDDSIFVWDSPDEHRHGRVFATSPADFVDSFDVERHFGFPIRSCFNPSNMGVSGYFWILDSDPDRDRWTGTVALLNCVESEEQHKLLGLLIKREDGSQQFKRNKTYLINPRSGQEGTVSARNVLIDEDRRSEARYRKIHIVSTYASPTPGGRQRPLRPISSDPTLRHTAFGSRALRQPGQFNERISQVTAEEQAKQPRTTGNALYSKFDADMEARGPSSEPLLPSQRQERQLAYREPGKAPIRRLDSREASSIHDFEKHARRCRLCRNPADVFRKGHDLCQRGHELCVEIDALVYCRNGEIWSRPNLNERQCRIELPRDTPQVEQYLFRGIKT